MYDHLMQRIADEMKRFGRDLQPPCRGEDLETLKRTAIEELGQTVPEGYARFLSKNDGFSWNGLLIFATKRKPFVGRTGAFLAGFVEENLGYWDCEPLKDYLIFAEDGVVFYTYHISANSYDTILRVGLTMLESFDSFDKLIASALKTIA
jgi:hypothetical protein